MKRALLRTVAFFAFAAAIVFPAAAQHPQLLKRHGVIYGVRDINPYFNCRGADPLAMCSAFVRIGTVLAVEHDLDPHDISGFIIRTKSGQRIRQYILPWVLPREGYSLVRPGRHLRIRGFIMGTGDSENASEIIALRDRQPKRH